MRVGAEFEASAGEGQIARPLMKMALMKRSLATLTLIVMSALGSTGAHAQACFTLYSVANDPSGVNGIRLTITRSLSLGTLVRPNVATSPVTVTLAPDGTRTNSARFIVPSHEQPNLAKAPFAAIIDINGKAGCYFRIDAAATPADLGNVRLQPTGSYTLSSTFTGAEGVLDASGKFQLTVGASQTITTSNAIGGSISVTVTYLNR